MKKILILIAVLVGAARLLMVLMDVPPHDFYRDFAHIFVGFLFGAGYMGKQFVYAELAWGLSFLELGSFLISRFI